MHPIFGLGPPKLVYTEYTGKVWGQFSLMPYEVKTMKTMGTKMRSIKRW